VGKVGALNVSLSLERVRSRSGLWQVRLSGDAGGKKVEKATLFQSGSTTREGTGGGREYGKIRQAG